MSVDRGLNTSAPPSEMTALPRMGSWSSWPPGRRRLVVVTVVNWIAGCALGVIGLVLNDWRIVALVFVLVAFDWLVASRRLDAEYSEQALAGIDEAPTTPEEQELLDELDSTGSDREADLLIVREWLAGNEVLRRYEYPTRELLKVRSLSEAVEVLGLAIVALTAPAVAPTAVGAVLWLLGGRAGASVARAALGERLYRTPVDDETRECWLRREHRAIAAVAVPVVAIAVLRFVT